MSGKPLYVRVAELLNQGKTREEIVKELGITRSQLRKAVYHAKRKGLIKVEEELARSEAVKKVVRRKRKSVENMIKKSKLFRPEVVKRVVKEFIPALNEVIDIVVEIDKTVGGALSFDLGDKCGGLRVIGITEGVEPIRIAYGPNSDERFIGVASVAWGECYKRPLDNYDIAVNMRKIVKGIIELNKAVSEELGKKAYNDPDDMEKYMNLYEKFVDKVSKLYNIMVTISSLMK